MILPTFLSVVLFSHVAFILYSFFLLCSIVLLPLLVHNKLID